MMKMFPLLAIVPISVLLTLSFFVLYTLRKVEEKPLKAFGYVVVGFIWLATLIMFSGAVYRMAKGPMPMKCMMQKRMGMMMGKDGMGTREMPEKVAVIKDNNKTASPKCGGNKGIVYKAE
ncbi:MAG: hypothetical protein WC543_02175 [Candidatus Omnitrophota bacterium]